VIHDNGNLIIHVYIYIFYMCMYIYIYTCVRCVRVCACAVQECVVRDEKISSERIRDPRANAMPK